MINKVAKGNRNENLAKEILKNDGFLVEKKPRTKWHSPDFYSQFDLLCIHPDRIPKLVQVKSTSSHASKARKDIAKWILDEKITGGFFRFEVWLYEGRSKWTIWVFGMSMNSIIGNYYWTKQTI